MSCGRLNNDNCAVASYLNQSIAPLGYRTNNVAFEHPTVCKKNTHVDVSRKWKDVGTRTDIESDLRNISRPLTKCPQAKFQSCLVDPSAKHCKVVSAENPWLCERTIVPCTVLIPAKCNGSK